MHRLAKFNVAEQCVSDVDSIILNRFQKLLDDYNDYVEESKHIADDPEIKRERIKKWRTLVASLPSGFVLGATMTTNYRQLKIVFLQRKNHRLREWKEFCKWIETLPYSKLITGGDIYE